MMAVFGGMFALMLVFLVIINVVSEQAMRERLRDSSTDGTYRIEQLSGGSGFVVITFPGALRIVETGEAVPEAQICATSSAYQKYAERIYANPGDQLLFLILEGSVPTMAVARNCLKSMWPTRELQISWIPADNEFLKSVLLDDIPAYIQNYATSQ